MDYSFEPTLEVMNFKHIQVKGFRDEQEDRFNTHMSFIESDTSQPLKLFSVHDGHVGTDTVEYLQGVVEDKWDDIQEGEGLMLTPPPKIEDDSNVKLLADLYTSAHNETKKNESGAVSITALAIKHDAVYFCWIGDCEGCLFLNDPTITAKGHIYHHPSQYVHTIDFAEVELDAPKLATDPSTDNHLTPVCSIPGSLLSGMQDRLTFPRKPRAESHAHPEHIFQEKESYTNFDKIVPNYFPNPTSKREFELVRLFREKKKNKKGNKKQTTMDIQIHKVGNAILTSDARISECIQPTRSIGDYVKCRGSILRFPTVMRVMFPDPPTQKLKDHCYILLCCDGFFSEYAFSGLADLCRFIANPDSFFSESFYCRGQVLTERLIAARLLPPSLEHVEDASQFPLYKEWKECQNWEEKITFITTSHMTAVKSEEFKAVVEEKSRHETWLRTCETTIKISENAWGPTFYREYLHNIAASMAVLMGSRDNVTLVMTKAFT